MFHKSDALERPAGVMNDELIPLSHLALDLDVPPEGWTVYLEGRGIAVVADDLGRLAIARSDARQLFVERRENEARKAQLRAAAELRAVQQDQQWRAQLGHGVPASAIPNGSSPAEALFAAELDSQVYLPRRASVAEDLLSNGGLTFHPLSPTEE